MTRFDGGGVDAVAQAMGDSQHHIFFTRATRTAGALGLVARIDDLDMERPMEGRAMDRGPGDIAINVTPD